jgi:hypothetical protein
MSGGSYNYLSSQAYRGDINQSDLRDMAERLEGFAPGTVAAAATRALLEAILHIESSSYELGDVWQAVEWWDSGDWGEDQAREAIATYEAEHGGPSAGDGPTPDADGLGAVLGSRAEAITFLLDLAQEAAAARDHGQQQAARRALYLLGATNEEIASGAQASAPATIEGATGGAR